MNRTKDELLKSCIEQFEHIDLTNKNKTLGTTKEVKFNIEQLRKDIIEKRLIDNRLSLRKASVATCRS